MSVDYGDSSGNVRVTFSAVPTAVDPNAAAWAVITTSGPETGVSILIDAGQARISFDDQALTDLEFTGNPTLFAFVGGGTWNGSIP